MKFGIVLYLDKPAVGHTAYTDIVGATRASQDLTTGYKTSDVLQIGRNQGILVQAATAYESTGATGITLEIEGAITDPLNPTTEQWSLLPCTRLDTVTSPDAIEQAIVSTSANVLFSCPKAAGCDKIRVSAKATGGTVKTGDRVVVHVNSL